MRPSVWNPAIELSLAEEKLVKRIRKAKLFVFLRQIRHELFDSDFQLELATIFKDSSIELRERQTTVVGRAKLRERVSVEHSLAHIGQWQGDQARYLGLRKNLFDLRRMAIVHNLHVLARISHTTPEKLSLLSDS